MKRVKVYLSLTVFALITSYFIWGAFFSASVNPVSLEEVVAVYDSLPIPPEAHPEGNRSLSARMGQASVMQGFHFPQGDDFVRDFYVKNLGKAGWSETMDDKKRGILVYCRSGISAAIYFPKKPAGSYTLMVAWVKAKSHYLYCNKTTADSTTRADSVNK